MVTSSVSCIMQRPLLALAEEGNLSLEAERPSEGQGHWDRDRVKNLGRNGGPDKDILVLFVCFNMFRFILFCLLVLFWFVVPIVFFLFNYIFVLMF